MGEIVEMIRKVFLCGGLIAIASGTSLQIIIAILVQFVYLLVIERTMPYDEFHDDFVQLVGSAQLFLTLFTGLILNLQQGTEKSMSEVEINGIGTLLVIINFNVIFAGVFSLWMATSSGKKCFEKCSNKKKKNKTVETEEVEADLQRIQDRSNKSKVKIVPQTIVMEEKIFTRIASDDEASKAKAKAFWDNDDDSKKKQKKKECKKKKKKKKKKK